LGVTFVAYLSILPHKPNEAHQTHRQYLASYSSCWKTIEKMVCYPRTFTTTRKHDKAALVKWCQCFRYVIGIRQWSTISISNLRVKYREGVSVVVHCRTGYQYQLLSTASYRTGSLCGKVYLLSPTWYQVPGRIQEVRSLLSESKSLTDDSKKDDDGNDRLLGPTSSAKATRQGRVWKQSVWFLEHCLLTAVSALTFCSILCHVCCRSRIFRSVVLLSWSWIWRSGSVDRSVSILYWIVFQWRKTPHQIRALNAHEHYRHHKTSLLTFKYIVYWNHDATRSPSQ